MSMRAGGGVTGRGGGYVSPRMSRSQTQVTAMDCTYGDVIQLYCVITKLYDWRTCNTLSRWM